MCDHNIIEFISARIYNNRRQRIDIKDITYLQHILYEIGMPGITLHHTVKQSKLDIQEKKTPIRIKY